MESYLKTAKQYIFGGSQDQNPKKDDGSVEKKDLDDGSEEKKDLDDGSEETKFNEFYMAKNWKEVEAKNPLDLEEESEQ